MTSIRKKYNKEVVGKLKQQFKLKNDLAAPRIKKVIVNVGIGKFLNDSGKVDDILQAITTITGQKPLMTQARKSIAGFKIREGLKVGMKVTLRGKRMWNFIERLVGTALPRIRDFHGIKESAVDSHGNLNIGIKEHMIFPEILAEEVRNIFGMEVTIVTTANKQEEGMVLFKALGFPIEIKE